MGVAFGVAVGILMGLALSKRARQVRRAGNSLGMVSASTHGLAWSVYERSRRTRQLSFAAGRAGAFLAGLPEIPFWHPVGGA